ncbi:hypothetical protein [Methylomicrobium lacus]|uniref:hypothetical protein n=1 Tax=Methylomicrobium lacus TaxID=136992 RepID=UPI001268396B|nr:hypothetical protein [Methylomicrobium lacus]
MPIITGQTACQISATGLGAVVGAISTGGNALAILVTGGAGYLLGRVVCRIPAIERAFDRAVGAGDWRQFEQVLADPKVREQAVAAISDETSVSQQQGEQIWDAIVLRLVSDRNALVGSGEFHAARHHPPTGSIKHGISAITLVVSGQS